MDQTFENNTLTMKQKIKHNSLRRQLIRLTGAIPFLAVTPTQANSVSTPSAAAGPYYPTPSMRYSDIDNDLVKITDKTVIAGGEIITLKGVVTDSELAPLQGVRIEIWQCDVNGRYLHTKDANSAELDTGFQGYGHTVTNEKGEYSFRTIKPVSYPGRTPHIHVKLFRDDEVLTTQFYIKDHPENGRDSLHRRMSASQQQMVQMEFSTRNSAIETVVNVIC